MKWTKNHAQKFLEEIFSQWGWDFIPQYISARLRTPMGGYLFYSYAIIDKSVIPWKPLLLIDLIYDGERAETEKNRKRKEDFAQELGLPYVAVRAKSICGQRVEMASEELRALIEQTHFRCEKD